MTHPLAPSGAWSKYFSQGRGNTFLSLSMVEVTQSSSLGTLQLEERQDFLQVLEKV